MEQIRIDQTSSFEDEELDNKYPSTRFTSITILQKQSIEGKKNIYIFHNEALYYIT